MFFHMMKLNQNSLMESQMSSFEYKNGSKCFKEQKKCVVTSPFLYISTNLVSPCINTKMNDINGFTYVMVLNIFL